jgi:hypothetical protein
MGHLLTGTHCGWWEASGGKQGDGAVSPHLGLLDTCPLGAV